MFIIINKEIDQVFLGKICEFYVKIIAFFGVQLIQL
jgi:hypothetical protein